jgi:hypothetical protein
MGMQARVRANGSTLRTEGRGTQLSTGFQNGAWWLVQVHNSGPPMAGRSLLGRSERRASLGINRPARSRGVMTSNETLLANKQTVMAYDLMCGAASFRATWRWMRS